MVTLFEQESISYIANVVTIIGLPLALWGLLKVAQQMKNDRLAVSAGAIGDLRLSIMEQVGQLSEARDPAEWEFLFREFANALEMACAIYLDGQMSGRSGRLARAMICDFLQMINDDEDMRAEMEKAIHSPDTFSNIRDFRRFVKPDD